MRKLFISALSVALFSFSGCGGGESHDSKSEATTTPATPATPAAPAAPAMKPPFPIADSSKVMVLDGGVKLYVIQEGNGIPPTTETTVTANYHGRLKDGTVFDSSFDRGIPADFGLNQVIKGWTVAFTKMKPGSRFVLVIPPDMGYGAQAQAKIPANSTLIFDCEFITTL
ncbi:MAG: FKBP-type peptidyl-prolyl cis-trans isomerase [Bacteroidia bacterium]|nr:FKBP-type peptidyl-prolyl cis-trans isomerase [Bacteroidia bacterium]